MMYRISAALWYVNTAFVYLSTQNSRFLFQKVQSPRSALYRGGLDFKATVTSENCPPQAALRFLYCIGIVL